MRLLLIVTALTLIGCSEQHDPWHLVSEEEKRAFFFECLESAPIAGDSIVRDCHNAASSWALMTGAERSRHARNEVGRP